MYTHLEILWRKQHRPGARRYAQLRLVGHRWHSEYMSLLQQALTGGALPALQGHSQGKSVAPCTLQRSGANRSEHEGGDHRATCQGLPQYCWRERGQRKSGAGG